MTDDRDYLSNLLLALGVESDGGDDIAYGQYLAETILAHGFRRHQPTVLDPEP